MENFDHLFIQPRDWGASFQFFTENLGWKVETRFGDARDAGRFAIIANGDFKLVLAEDHDVSEPAKKPATYLTKGKISLHFHTDDVDAVFAAIKDKSSVAVQPENNHWGTRWFVLEDPDGNQFGWQGPPKEDA